MMVQRAREACLVAFLGVALVACQQTVSFSVLRAARVNVKGIAGEGKDATVAVGQWTGTDSAAVDDIKQRLTDLITNAEGGVVKLSLASGVVTLSGEVGEHAYSETQKSESTTCSRYNPNTKKSESYPCTRRVRTGSARARISMKVVDQTGKVVASDTYSDRVQQETSSTEGDPDAIDGQAMLAALRGAAASRLAELVVPHRVVVTKSWNKCGDANPSCDGGLTQLRAGNFAGAKELFNKAIDQLRAAPKQDAKAIAAAWWGVALANEFGGDYAAARAALGEAIKLDPTEEMYPAEQKAIAVEESNSKQLAKQGVGGE